MKRREWDPKKKAMIVLQGLRGKPIADLCIEHQISQAQYYQWRDQFLAGADRVFSSDPEKSSSAWNARSSALSSWWASSPRS